MEREENDGFGTVYYAISILLVTIFSYLQSNPMIGTTGMLIMGYGDGFAAIFGKKLKVKNIRYQEQLKVLLVQLQCFVFSLVISCVVFYMIGIEYFILKALLTAVIATLLEAVSVKGLDNITVPIMVTVMTYLFI